MPLRPLDYNGNNSLTLLEGQLLCIFWSLYESFSFVPSLLLTSLPMDPAGRILIHHLYWIVPTSIVLLRINALCNNRLPLPLAAISSCTQHLGYKSNILVRQGRVLYRSYNTFRAVVFCRTSTPPPPKWPCSCIIRYDHPVRHKLWLVINRSIWPVIYVYLCIVFKVWPFALCTSCRILHNKIYPALWSGLNPHFVFSYSNKMGLD